MDEKHSLTEKHSDGHYLSTEPDEEVKIEPIDEKEWKPYVGIKKLTKKQRRTIKRYKKTISPEDVSILNRLPISEYDKFTVIKKMGF